MGWEQRVIQMACVSNVFFCGRQLMLDRGEAYIGWIMISMFVLTTITLIGPLSQPRTPE